MKILVIDDEVKLANAIGEIFRQHKYVVDTVYDGEDGLYCAKNGNYDVILLDIMMPKMDGFEVVQKLRQSKINTPVIMLTAKDDLESKVKGLDFGADDYLPKPFAVEELLARVRALSRRQQEIVPTTITYQDITLDTNDFSLHCGNQSISLGAKEYNILHFMLSNPKQVLSKETIISKVWGLDSDITDNNVEAYMSFLRKKLQFVGSKLTIQTKRMLGYYLEADRD